jgi:hypothetical protein
MSGYGSKDRHLWGAIHCARTGDGLGVSVGSFSAIPCGGLGNVARTGVFMTTHSLENSVRILKRVRDTYNSQLDTSVLKQLDEVITDLEEHVDKKDKERDAQRRSRALQVLGIIIHVITNVKDWME